MKKVLILAALATASATSFAQTTFGEPNPSPNRLLYGELGISEFELEDDRLPGYSSDNEALTAIVGYKFHPNIAGEALLATGVSEQDVGFGGTTVSSELDYALGLYVRPSMMASDKLEVFGRLGMVAVDWSLSGPAAPALDSDASFSYGAGLNYYFTDNLYGQFSYTSLYDRDDTEAKGYTLAVGMKF
jgi:opacity protein-like surface antigen